MLEYLVTSRSRRELLRRLWTDGDSGSVSALARGCGLSFTAAHRELQAMEAAGLAIAERRGAAIEYRAERRHAQAQVLVALLKPFERKNPCPVTQDALVEKLVASHQDEAAALALPLALWREREGEGYGHLLREATRRNERQALGLFLELAGQLSGDRRLRLRASFLRDRRRTALRPYFTADAGDAPSDRSLPLARRWGYVLNIDLARFAAAFKRSSRPSRG
jgi:hypothetical protein